MQRPTHNWSGASYATMEYIKAVALVLVVLGASSPSQAHSKVRTRAGMIGSFNSAQLLPSRFNYKMVNHAHPSTAATVW